MFININSHSLFHSLTLALSLPLPLSLPPPPLHSLPFTLALTLSLIQVRHFVSPETCMKAVWWTYRQAVDDLKWNRWSKASTEVVTKLIGMELFIEEQENMVAPSSICRSVLRLRGGKKTKKLWTSREDRFSLSLSLTLSFSLFFFLFLSLSLSLSLSLTHSFH